jgi:hypothetical protein
MVFKEEEYSIFKQWLLYVQMKTKLKLLKLYNLIPLETIYANRFHFFTCKHLKSAGPIVNSSRHKNFRLNLNYESLFSLNN